MKENAGRTWDLTQPGWKYCQSQISAAWSTIIGPGMSKLGTLMPSLMFLYSIRDRWLSMHTVHCTERIYYRRPDAIRRAGVANPRT